ncbi:MAG: CPBP family intramembrane metalloprotease [Candidatus Symbiothrix sp.]|jgi:membrane protease YdiL (CAAX protease family)|nr:CPBP family intramembrane metalloprotease [Candidatus Symbiothrix sp.]
MKVSLKNAKRRTQLWVLTALLFAGTLITVVVSRLLNSFGFLDSLLVFVLPALLCAYLFSDNLWNYLHLTTPVNWKIVGLTVLSVIAVYPFINLLNVLNQSMVLPEALHGLEEWMRASETAVEAVLKKILYVNNVWEFIRNVLTMCLLAAVGEELTFRGVLTNILKKGDKMKPVMTIWVVAIIFSAIHFQFYGFVPRMLLGAYFGYLVYYTQSLWMPIIAHFTHNFISIATCTAFQDAPDKMEQVDQIGSGSTLWLSGVSVVLFALIFRQIIIFFHIHCCIKNKL